MAYRALYRIYRPALFGEVAGQDHITDVLRNQVKLGRLSHAYLFCGPRGTGKTTMAKILSRAANCIAPVDGEPCGECEMCRISSSVNADIMEIDAASNNGVDNVRDLIDQAQFAPLQLRKRVFIIDEVHMLSQSAFNALLKTLEEPPSHVLFILATTEPEKLLATVISRCQRFDFKRLAMPDIVEYMNKVLNKEGIKAEPDALRAIAHSADGGMRDALSLLNQCVSISNKNLTLNNVKEVLGSVEEDILFSLTDSILCGDGKSCIDIIEKVVRSGKDLGVLAKDLSSHIHSLLLTSICGKCADILEVTDEAASRYEMQAKAASKEEFLYLSEELIQLRSSVKNFPNPRLLLETAILRMACPEGEVDHSSILARLSSLERRMESAGNINAGTAPAASVSPNAHKADVVLTGDYEHKIDEVNPEINYSEILDSDLNKEKQDTLNENSLLVKTQCQNTAIISEPSEQPSMNDGTKDIDEQKLVFNRFRAVLQNKNRLAFMALNNISSYELMENRLILYYEPQNSAKLSMFAKPALLAQIQEAAAEIKPDLTVIWQVKKADALATDTILTELFGDKLTIE